MCNKKLTDIYDNLFSLLKKLSRSPIEADYIQENLSQDMEILTDVINSGNLNEQCKITLQKINEVSESISFILGVRLNLKARCSFHYQDNTALDQEYTTTESFYDHTSLSLSADTPEKNEIIAVSTTYDKSKKIDLRRSDSDDFESFQDRKKSKRLPKSVVNVLNAWYFENADNPYLTKDDIMELKIKTGLQETQIKNWASNKRRKKKENPVSVEILKVLHC